ncbi:MAG: Chromosome partition protein Smc [Promethearchaeota archaeon]|nr:MAG: Chromosome partition protein Smc [Candidatus Lokiarchaeota archaeon]
MSDNSKETMEIGRKNPLERPVHIQKVILENFLSFKKDEVNIGDNKFIIIIGPNWSGKTSIFQGIKFALGSNERGERYPKWSDFIRHGQDHTMVEIHILDNSNLLKIRRTVVKGHSPFFELKTPKDKEFRKVKASEIQEIVSELHYNPDNQFAFVSQGKIDAIKDLKPTELCTFLEEGIGLIGLRKEILQKKDDIEILNSELLSLNTKKNSLNINLELLRPKLERLEEKKKLEKRKRNFEDELLWANRQKLLLEIVDLTDEVKKLNSMIHTVETQKQENLEEAESLSKEIEQIEDEINKISKELGQNEYRKQDLVGKIKRWQKAKVQMKEELDRISEKRKIQEKKLENLQKQKVSIHSNLSAVDKEVSDIEEKIEELIKEQAELSDKIEENKVFLEQYNQLASEIKQKERQIEKNRTIIQDLDSQINQLFQSFKDIKHKLDKNKWFLENPTKNLLKELDVKLEKTSSRLFAIEEELKKLEHEKSRKINEFKRLRGSLDERRIVLPTNINILKDEIRKRDLAVKGPIIEYIKYDDKLSYAIESVLGEKLLYSFVASDWDTLDLLKRLKEKYKAYCNIYVPKSANIHPLRTFEAEGAVGYLAELIKTNDIEIKKVIYSKVKNCLVVKDYRSGKDMYKKYNFKGKCVTLKGEQIISYKYVYETPYRKQLKGLLSAGTQKEQADKLENQIKRLTDNISDLKVQASKLDNIQKDIYNKKRAFNDLLYNFNQKQRITSKKNQLYEQKANLEELNTQLSKEIDILKTELKELEKEKSPDFFKWNERLNKIPNQLKDLNKEKKEWNKKLAESREIYSAVDAKISKVDSKIELLSTEFETKQENFQKADKEAFEIYRELDDVETNINELNEKIYNLKEKRKEKLADKSILDKKRIELELKIEQETINLKHTKQELNSRNEDLARVDREIGGEKKEEEIETRPVQEIKDDIFQIDKELLKYYDVDDSILVERDQIMSSLKKIAKNQKDLENDINAAKDTENKLESTYYRKFESVLEELESKINYKFEASEINVYCALELIGNFEELGVDIKAATSNKPLISCTALSGGQVSMVSIALILSLQEMRPSPLCMFDEAAMFLDDKNAEITYELIKSTLEHNPIQMIMFLPKSSNALYKLAEQLIGVARVGKEEVSTIFKPKIVEHKG